MPIRFKCPHCKKGLVVKEQMAGKKAACPACKKVLSVPATVSAPADLEAFAAAALADQPVTPPPQTDGKSDGKVDGKTNGRTDGAAPPSAPAPAIEFNCEFCDTRLKFDADMGGKKAPCTNPECRRIIKVPMPKIERPKDWRELSKGPSAVLAKKPEQLEGAWGTATDKSKVSQAALAEADAIIEVDEDESSAAMRWLRRGLWIGGVGGALFLTIWGLSRRHEVTTQREAIDLALEAVDATDHKDAKKIPAAWAAVVLRGAGEHHVTKKKAATAQQYFTKARAMLPADPAVDADLFRKVLAASEVTLGGSDEQARDGERLPWADAFTYIKRPIGDIKSSEARVLAAREVGTLLLRK